MRRTLLPNGFVGALHGVALPRGTDARHGGLLGRQFGGGEPCGGGQHAPPARRSSAHAATRIGDVVGVSTATPGQAVGAGETVAKVA